jgi:lipoprotein-releasing system ATP-binding protein
MSEAVPSEGSTVLSAVKLTKIYPSPISPIVIFEELDLSVARGSLIAVVGPSGAGKSTLLHLLGGLDRPTSGQVLFADEDIFRLDADRLAEYRNRHVGFVFQFHHLLPEFTAVENAAMPLMVRGLDRESAIARASSILDRVGLGNRAEHKPGELSGGEQQRVAIARALVGDSELLLADEPTGNLDAGTGAEVFEIIRGLHKERGLTSVIVTHNEQIASMCHHVWHIEGGQLRGL